MSLKHWFRPPRHLLVIFLVIVLLPSTLLLVSGWQLMRQEEARATAEHQARMADVVVAELRQRVAGIDAQLRERHGEFLPGSGRDDFVFAVFDGDTASTTPAHRLLFYPATPASRELPVEALAEVHDLHRRGEVDAELAAWRRISSAPGATVQGIPADLFARWAQCDLLDAARRPDELKECATALYADLHTGRWPLDRRMFETQVELVSLLLETPSPPPTVASARTLSAAVEQLWQRWRSRAVAPLEPSGHQLVAFDGQQLALLWRAEPTRLAVFAATTAFVEHEWMSPLRESGNRQSLRISLRDPGASAADIKETRQVAAETKLPWTVAVTSVGTAESRLASGRFRLWLAGAALLSLIVVGGAVVIARAAARELAVARLQTDFVAAVSHEFRTPLTSLRQIGEVLHDGRVAADRRQTYYEAIVRQTERLHHLVETLLDFGRMEAGRSPYRKEPIDLTSWARSVVNQFNHEVSARGYSAEPTLADQPIRVLGDPQALSNALWNLLDNAVKYSPECRTVWIAIEQRDDAALIHVRDRGLGIPPGEQLEIFGKFVRGSEAKRLNIVGTGIGLAMVEHIIKAHGGSVRVNSQPGEGSTFSLVIPCHAS